MVSKDKEMKNLPLVSIITPSYNQGRFIEETILSIKFQDYPSIEHIVIDGGSTDQTIQILKKYNDSIVWVSEPDKGQSNGINKGFKKAKGEIVTWLNSDDLYYPGAIGRVVNYFLRYPKAGIVYGECDHIDEEGKLIKSPKVGRFNLRALKKEDIIAQPSLFFLKDLLETVGPLDENLHLAMDYDLWVRMARKEIVAKYIPITLAKFRVHPLSKTYDPINSRLESLLVIKRYFGLKSCIPTLGRCCFDLKTKGYPLDAVPRILKDKLIKNGWCKNSPTLERCILEGLMFAYLIEGIESACKDKKKVAKDLMTIIRKAPLVLFNKEGLIFLLKLILGEKNYFLLKDVRDLWVTLKVNRD